MMDDSEFIIRISPKQGKITVEENDNGIFSRKNITVEALLQSFKQSVMVSEPGYASGFLPLNTLSVCQSAEEKRIVLWHPKLYADVSV